MTEEPERVGGRVRLGLERRDDGDHEREDVDDRDGDQEAVGQRARDPLAPAPTAPWSAGCAGRYPAVALTARPSCPRTPARRGSAASSTLSRSRVTIRVMTVKKTMIANRMKASAAPTPHSFELNEALNEGTPASGSC